MMAGADVCLVHMPFAAVERPSLGLGLLQAILAREGLSATTLYANVRFADRIGFERYTVVDNTYPDSMVAEWTFAGAAFPGFEPDHARYFRGTGLVLESRVTPPGESLGRILWGVRAAAPAFVDETARAVLATGARIVGCTSTFQQHCASLALLRRVRELDPAVTTLLGGANCEAEMGAATHRAFPWVDFVVSGEADELIGPLCRAILAEGRDIDAARVPYGALGPAHRRAGIRGEPPRASVHALDGLPTPDFGDYFRALETSGLAGHVVPGLPVETSRGCWWGQKHHCTFCGLNGGNMQFRAKRPERAIAELDELAARHGVRQFLVVDNILDMRSFDSVLPRLAARAEPYRLFFETKANLRRTQVELLAACGARWIQPGLESLHDEVLRLMAKGTTGLINLQLLKWGQELGIRVYWNMLCDFPGEDDAWYAEMAPWLPLLFHLQPPAFTIPVRYDRFSPYHSRPDAYGIRLAPFWTYRYVYPLDGPDLADLAYFFEDGPGSVRRPGRDAPPRPGLEAVQAAVTDWRRHYYGAEPPVLNVAQDDGEALVLVDTRPAAVDGSHVLDGLARRVYRECDAARTPAAIAEALAREPGPPVEPGAVAAALDDLAARRLVLARGGKILALATRGVGTIPSYARYPGGYSRAPAVRIEAPSSEPVST